MPSTSIAARADGVIPAGSPTQTRRRVALRAAAVAGVAALITLAAGIAYARLSASRPTQTSTLAAGSVSLTTGATGACATTNMLPGATPAPCTLTATYGGTVPGWLALDVLIETQAGNGGAKLYTPSDGTHDLQVTVTSTTPTVTYTVPATATTCPSSAPSGSTCYEIDDQLVSTTAFTSSSPAVTFTTSVALPASSTTGYRGGAAQVILTAHAAQSVNNSASGCTPGHACASVHWS